MFFFRIKSERINRLRKVYDTFLEEDKKRKERNEFILGRLDKMRYYSTALQLRHQVSIIATLAVIRLKFNLIQLSYISGK